MTMQLPPLPEPKTIGWKNMGGMCEPDDPIKAYTADQLRDYANLACKERDALIGDLVKALATASWALREPLDGWKGEVSRKALDAIGAVLAKVPK